MEKVFQARVYTNKKNKQSSILLPKKILKKKKLPSIIEVKLKW